MMEQPIDKYKSAEKLELKEIVDNYVDEFKKVHCPSCQTEVSAANMELLNRVAKCGDCNVIFSIEEDVESIKQKVDMRQEILKPEGIDLFYFKDDLDITIQHHLHGLDVFGVIFMPLFAALSILAYYSKDLSIYLPVALTLGALYFIYRAFNSSKNKTYIDINDKFLNIKFRPKNLKKDKSYAADEIEQVYLKYSTEAAGYYALHMVINGLDGQKHVKLLTVNTLSKAKYLEQEIERYLHIKDKKVPEGNV